MKAEIAFDADGQLYMCITPSSPTEHAMLQYASPKLGLEYDLVCGEARLRSATPVVTVATLLASEARDLVDAIAVGGVVTDDVLAAADRVRRLLVRLKS